MYVAPNGWQRNASPNGYFPGFHHLIVRFEDYDERKLRVFIETWVSRYEDPDWEAIAKRLRLFGQWEYEDYRH